jgi:hypothetical protein
MAALADAAYSAPPAAHAPVLSAGLAILDHFRRGDHGVEDVLRYRDNLARLEARATWASRLLTEQGIPHVAPSAGASLAACLVKVPRCREQAERLVRALIREHGIFLETGGHFIQNPSWPFTLARLGLARRREAFEQDLIEFCRFYREYAPAQDSSRPEGGDLHVR